MDEIRKRDIQVFLKELVSPGSVFVTLLAGGCLGMIAMNPFATPSGSMLVVGASVVLGLVISAYLRSIPRRFQDRRFGVLWREAQVREKSLKGALAKLKKSNIADLSELPTTVRRMMPEIYRALRRADMVQVEVRNSEKAFGPMTSASHRTINDPQAQELYRVADRNIAEYTTHLKAALAGVERAEAQAVVFSTTLDTLRIRMLNYRLTGRAPDLETREFLNVIAEAKMQFAAIDKALDEIEGMPFPTLTTLAGEPVNASAESRARDAAEVEMRATLSQTPPPVPDHVQNKLNQSEDA